jgi:Gpi18-like mannosyltransferase
MSRKRPMVEGARTLFGEEPQGDARLRGIICSIRASDGLGLALILALALLIRLPFLFDNAHVSGDIKIYRTWGERIYRQGLTAIYDTPDVDYPPLLLYVFGATACLVAHLPPTWTAQGAAQNALIKLPAVLADLLTTGLIGWALCAQQVARWRAAALLYAFNPAIWYVSTIWGQTDAIYTLFLVAAMMSLARGALAPAWIAYALALGTKGQAIFLAPLIIMLTLARHGVRGLVRGVTASASVGALLTTPWLLSDRISLVWQRYTLPARPFLLVVSAYNIWYLMLWGQIGRFPPTNLLPGLPVSYRAVALGMYAVFVLLMVGLLWKDPRRPWMLAAVLLNLGMFILLPQMYERYMFATIVFLLLGAANWSQAGASGTDAPADKRPRLWWTYGVLSLTFLVNLVIISRFAPVARSNRLTVWPNTLTSAVIQGLALTAAVANTVVWCWLSARFIMWRAKDITAQSAAAPEPTN